MPKTRTRKRKPVSKVRKLTKTIAHKPSLAHFRHVLKALLLVTLISGVLCWKTHTLTSDKLAEHLSAGMFEAFTLILFKAD